MAQPLEQLIGGKYSILHKIKEGGMGSIYRVRHRLLEEERVVKVLKPQYALDEEFRARFKNEARAAIRLRHPNIAHLYDFSVDDTGNSYIVMEYIAGVTLQQLVANTGPPSLGLAIEIARQCLEALGYLHRQGFVHRDIASDNLMLTTDFADDPLVKLIDLGIAKAKESDVDLTATGVFMGKARYSPPEQFAAEGGAAALDRRSDIYSFGVMLYELLTGRFPIEGNDFSQIVAGHLFREPLGFEETDPEERIPAELRQIVLRCLAKEPAERFQSMEDLHQALEPFREPKTSKQSEFRRALKSTSDRLAAMPRTEKPGSTQSRLDGQFPAAAISGVSDEGEAPGSSDGGPRPVVADAPPAAADGAQTTRHDKPGKRVDRRTLVLAAAGAVALAAVVTVLLFVGRGGGEAAEEAGAPADGTLTVAFADGWSPAVAVLDPGEWSAWDDPTIGDPPPTPDEEAERTAAAAAPPVAVPDPVGEPVRPSEETPNPPPITAAEADSGPETEPSSADPATPRAGRRPVSAGDLQRGTPGVVPPVLTALPKPTPPAGARRRAKEVLVIVGVLVDERGRVIDTRIEKGPLFRPKYRERAIEIASGARFRPAQRDGLPGRMWTEVRVVFHRGQR